MYERVNQRLEFNEAFTKLFDSERGEENVCRKDREIDFFPLDERRESQLEKKRERLLSVKQYTSDGPSLR